MGFFDRFRPDKAVPSKLMSDEQAADLKRRQDLAKSMMPAGPAEGADYAASIQNVMKNGVEAPGVIRSMRQAGPAVDFVVAVEQPGGGQVDVQVHQHMLPAQLEGLREGGPVVVKYDPSDPAAGLLVSW